MSTHPAYPDIEAEMADQCRSQMCATPIDPALQSLDADTDMQSGHGLERRRGRAGAGEVGKRKKKLGNSPRARTERVVVMLSRDELTDLCTMAEAWQVPLSSLVWSIACDWLERACGRKTQLGQHIGALMMATERLLHTEGGLEAIEELVREVREERAQR